VRQETGIQKSNIWAKQNLLIPKRGFGLNSGYNGTTDQRRTAAGTIPMLKQYMERDLGEFVFGTQIDSILRMVPVHWHLVTSATNVASWDDLSGNGWSAIQDTSANQPTLGTDGGVNCLSFDGNDFMTLGNVMASATSGFYIGLIKFTSDPTAGSSTTAGMPYVQSGTSSPVFWGDGNVYEQWGSSSNRPTFGNPTPSLTNWTIYQVQNDGTSSGHIVRINGTVLGQATSTVGWSATPRFGGSSSWFFNGKIAEIIALKRIPTPSEREYLEGYIAWRAGIASVLPVGHPYKSSAP
jgi:hypothetical protein